MKMYPAILLLILLLGLSSCHSSKKSARVSYGDDIYAEKQITTKDAKAKLSPVERLLAEAYSWKGTPYKSGGHSRSGTDCSGFTMEVFRTALGVELPRNSAKQIEACDKVKRNKIQPGDLLFFHPSKKGKISHVGIYVGDGKMLHASSSGVMESDITLPYWEKCYNRAGRVKYDEKSQAITNTESKPKGKQEAAKAKKGEPSSVPANAVTSAEWSF